MNTTGRILATRPTEEIIQLDQTFFPNPWTQKQWLDLNPETHTLYQLISNDQLVGFALFGTLDGEETAHLYKILVHPRNRGTISTHSFWMAMVSELKAKGFLGVYLEVEASNTQAIKFYLKVGFKQLRRNKAYYSNGDDALIMQLTL